MRKTIISIQISSLIFLFVSGCNPSGDEIRAYAIEAQQILQRMDTYRDVLEDLAEEMKRDGLISPEQLARVSEAKRMIDELQNRLSRIATAIGGAEFSDDHTLSNTLAALRVASTVAGTYPYSGHVSVVLAALAAIAGLWGRRQATNRKLAEATTAIIVKSIEKAKVNGSVKLDDVKQDRAIERVVSEIRAA